MADCQDGHVIFKVNHCAFQKEKYGSYIFAAFIPKMWYIDACKYIWKSSSYKDGALD